LATGSIGLAAFLAVRSLTRHGSATISGHGDDMVPIWIALLAGVVSLLGLVWGVPAAGLGGWRRLSVAYTVACVLSLTGIWMATARAEPDVLGFGSTVLDEGEVDAYLAAEAGGAAQEFTLRIPTGVSIQSIEFLDANNVLVTGYVWQKYGDELPDDFVQGIVLPEAIEEDHQASEAWRERGRNYELVGWYVKATLRLTFDYRRYPFDHQDVRLRVQSADRREGVLLVPDFSSYPAWQPDALAGVEPNFVGEGWEEEYSVFTYAASPVTTTFGRTGGVTDSVRPDLYFNVGLHRHAFDVLVDRVLLLGAALLMVVCMVLATERTPDGFDRYGLSVGRMLGLGAALLFVLVLDYGQFRSALRPEGLTYLGFAYLVLLLGLILAIVNGMLYACNRFRFRLIEYENNAIPNLLFAPLLLTIYLAITIALFYGG
jgi:hypothetical protein